MSIDDMPAGREMDALAAEKVMEYTLDYEFGDMLGAPSVKELRSQYDEWGLLPPYSTDIAAAWQVVEQLLKLGFHVRVEEQDKTYVRVWHQHMNEFGPEPLRGNADTAPLAICRAALKAVGMEAK